MAKHKKAPAPAPGKTKSTHAQRRAARKKKGKSTKITRVTKETREVRSNPAFLKDMAAVLVPAFLAYAGTRVLQRVVFSIIQKRYPKFGKHAHAISGVAAFGGAYFLAHRIKQIAQYHDGIVVGSGIAAAHGVATCYLPKKYNWLLADCRPEDVQALPANASAAAIAAASTSDGDEYGSYIETDEPAAPQAQGAAPAEPVSPNLDYSQVLADGEDVDDLYTGPFAN